MATTMTAPAESSTATFEIPQGDARAEFMKTGEVPEVKPKAESAPAKETPAAGDKPAEKTAPASEPGKEIQEPKRNSAEARLKELLDDLKTAGYSPTELKTLRRQAERTSETKTEPAKAEPEKTVNPVDPRAPIKPRTSDFEGKPWEQYEAAKDKYFEDLAEYKALKAVEARDAQNKQEASAKELNTRIEVLSKQYGADAREPIQNAAKQVFEDPKVNGIVKEMVNGSPVLVDVLYTLGGDEAGLRDFLEDAKSNPGAAIRKFVLLEKLVTEELAKGSSESGTDRGEDGKFKSNPEKKTAAPVPPKEVSGRASPPPDEVESATQSALKSGNSRAAIDAENRAEIRRLKGR